MAASWVKKKIKIRSYIITTRRPGDPILCTKPLREGGHCWGCTRQILVAGKSMQHCQHCPAPTDTKDWSLWCQYRTKYGIRRKQGDRMYPCYVTDRAPPPVTMSYRSPNSISHSSIRWCAGLLWWSLLKQGPWCLAICHRSYGWSVRYPTFRNWVRNETPYGIVEFDRHTDNGQVILRGLAAQLATS